jgi:hypothetical protein
MTEAGASRASPGQILATLAALAPDSQPAVEIKVSKDDTVAVPLSYLAVFQGHSGLSVDSEPRRSSVDPFLIESMVKRARLRDEGARSASRSASIPRDRMRTSSDGSHCIAPAATFRRHSTRVGASGGPNSRSS